MKVIITMAGLGSRFKNAGFVEEKHAILFHNQPLFDWAIESLINFRAHEFIFVTRNFPKIARFIKERTQKMGIEKTHVVIIDKVTRGQAETAILADHFFSEDDSIIIYNTDTHVEPATLKPEFIRGNGWIPTFSGLGDRWSFVEAKKDGTVIRTTEKNRISENCSVGLYYFDSFYKFKSLVLNLEKKPKPQKEWYIAPLYNEFIQQHNKVYIHQLPANSVLVLGTPEDLVISKKIINKSSD